MPERFKAVAAVYLLLEQDEKILLLKRANTGYMDGWYGVPAGHHDGGEPVTAAMCREAREEAGIEVRPEDLVFLHVMHRMANDHERIDFYFKTKKYEGEVRNMEPERCSELAWFPLDNLPENIIPVVKQAMLCIRDGVAYSEAKE
jgi:ADP-ribose pyrophosphatase YjhB (NUDIX family)